MQAKSMLLALFCLAMPLVPAWANHGSIEPLLEELSWIEQQTGWVQCARATFTVKYLPTTNDEMRRVGLYFRLRDQEYRAGSYYWSEHQAKRRSYRSTWYRQGILEREERNNIARPAITETTVFDGQVIKTLDSTPGRTCLYLTSPSAGWIHQSRIQPYSFALEFRNSSHGQLIRQSPERRMVRMKHADGMHTEVLIQHPSEERLLLRLVFDEKHRLLLREAILTRSSSTMTLERDEPMICSRHEFSEHRPYDDGQGNSIWFPSKAMLRYYLGSFPDGTPVQSYAIQIDIADVEFNGHIPPEKFKLEPPEGVPVYDHRQDRYSTVSLSY